MPQAGGSGLFSLAVAVVIVAGLYFGRDVLVPLALAVLLSFALAPPVRWLRRLRVPRLPAVVAVVMVAFCLIGGIAGVIGWQIADLAQSLPRYQSNVESKLQSLRETPPGGTISGEIDVAPPAAQRADGRGGGRCPGAR